MENDWCSYCLASGIIDLELFEFIHKVASVIELCTRYEDTVCDGGEASRKLNSHEDRETEEAIEISENHDPEPPGGECPKTVDLEDFGQNLKSVDGLVHGDDILAREMSSDFIRQSDKMVVQLFSRNDD